jgi:hypothetical protein
VLVDTKLANNGQGILDQVKSVTNKPVTMIINTHTHGDHVGSNMFFPGNVEIVTHENTKANMEKMPVYQDAANKNGMPDRTFKDRLTVLGGNDAIDLYYFGPAHTNGIRSWYSESSRLHAGDVFANTAAAHRREQRRSGIAATPRQGRGQHQERRHRITGHTDVKKWQDFVTTANSTGWSCSTRARRSRPSDGRTSHGRFCCPTVWLHAHRRPRSGGNFNVIQGAARTITRPRPQASGIRADQAQLEVTSHKAQVTKILCDLCRSLVPCRATASRESRPRNHR